MKFSDAVALLEQLNDELNKSPQDDVDEFTRKKKEIHVAVKAIRKQLKQRDQSSADSQKVAQMSVEIKQAIRNTKEEVTQLNLLVQKDKKKGDLLEARKEIVTLCYKHLEECEHLEKKRYVTDELFSDGAKKREDKQKAKEKKRKETAKESEKGEPSPLGGVAESNPFDDNPFEKTDLPDIDIKEELVMIKQTNQQIDTDLDVIAEGVEQIRGLATTMNTELAKQDELMERIEVRVEKTEGKLDNLNKQMRQAMNGIVKSDRSLLNYLMICVFIAILLYIVGQFVL